LYIGQRWDSVAMLNYYKNRYIDPLLGRYLNRDSLGYKDGMNIFSYCHGTISSLIDPLGLETIAYTVNCGGGVSITVNLENCTCAQMTTILTAVCDGYRAMIAAEADLNGLIKQLAQQPLNLAQTQLQSRVNTLFGMSTSKIGRVLTKDEMQTIVDNIHGVSSSWTSPGYQVPIECTSSSKNAIAQTYRGFLGMTGFSDIWLYQPFWKLPSTVDQAAAIVHESLHKYSALYDYVYASPMTVANVKPNYEPYSSSWSEADVTKHPKVSELLENPETYEIFLGPYIQAAQKSAAYTLPVIAPTKNTGK
ncbi:MAG: RHS repeat-associated core domain-containing protein, partial [Rhodanobacteraceae bacterium]